jgi:NADH:ubiquinone oxidoreductase subunit 6 (subunit J)
MLLGAEKLMQPETKFRWLTPVAVVLSVAFLLVTGLALVSGQINLNVPPGGQPTLRVVHVATDTGPVDVYANGELLIPNVSFRDETEFIPLPPGDYIISLRLVGLASDLVTGNVTLSNAPGQQTSPYTIVAYGEGPQPVLGVVNDNLSSVEDDASRVTVFNAYSSPVNLVDFNSEFDQNDDVVIVSELSPGSVAQPLEFAAEKEPGWAFVDPTNNTVLYRLNNPDIFTVQGGTAQLVILTAERLFDGSARAVAHSVSNEADASFGGPEFIGELLFTRYLLPFEMVSVLLLVAIIGAIVLTQREHVPAIRKRDIRRKVSRPLTSVISAQTGSDLVAANGQEQPQEQPTPVGK